MGVRNYLIEGVSGAGKTAVCRELRRRGFQAINGDRELAYQGDPATGRPVDGLDIDDNERVRFISEHHVWNVDRVKALVADQSKPMTFFCGGSRNFPVFIDLFDGVFVLDIDVETLMRRLDERPEDEWGGKGRLEERELILRLHRTKAEVPNGTIVDATKPIERVVDEILRRCGAEPPRP